MKILLLCYELPPVGGGGAKVVDGLSKELIRQGHDVDIVTMGYKGLLNYEENRRLKIYRTIWKRRNPNTCTPFEMCFYLITAFPLILKLCREKKYHINHTHFIFPDGILSWLVKIVLKLPYVITAHGSDVPGYNPNRFKILHCLLCPLWKIIVRKANRVIFPSQHLKMLASKVLQDIPSKIIPNGFDSNKFSPYQTKQKRILVVTRMFERKGVQFFLHALEGIEQDFEINIIGDGPYLKSLKELAIKLRLKINFLGFVENQSEKLKKLFEGSLIFIFTSEMENFPIVLMEAMAAGLAIITTKGTGCEEVVGNSAILVRPRDAGEIKEALLTLLNNNILCKQLGSAAHRRVDDKFSWRSVGKQHLDLYLNVMEA